MPYTAQKPLNPVKLISVSLTEALFTLSWAALGGAVLMPVTSYWYLGIIPAFLAAVWVLSRIELAEETGPLQAFEVRQYSSRGERKVSSSRTFFRLLCTAILFPAAMISCLPLLFRQRSLPELLTGTKLTVTDRRLDPRPARMIEEKRRSAMSRSRILILVPLAAAAGVFVLRHSVPEAVTLPVAEMENTLPEHERELLSHYLEMTTLHPEELEYHVRLASLFYRNGMDEDLEAQLEMIRAMDPDHAILILGTSTEFSFDELIPPEDTLETQVAVPEIIHMEPAEEDSTAADSTEEDAADSLAVPEDSLGSAPEVPDTLPALETEPLTVDTLPATEQQPVDTLSVPEEIIPEEEVTLEPDTIVQP